MFTFIWKNAKYHDDVIKRKHFPRYWPFGTLNWSIYKPLHLPISVFLVSNYFMSNSGDLPNPPTKLRKAWIITDLI